MTTNRFQRDSDVLDQERALLSRAFAPSLVDRDLREVLRFLNGLTGHRYTGVYRFEPGWVVSVCLYDRMNPDLEIGADVKMKESYCWLTGLDDKAYIIEDALTDSRLGGHAAQEEVRSYVAVLLRDSRRVSWGTLCHFDHAPQKTTLETLHRLERFRPLVEEMLVRDRRAHWDPDAPSVERATRVEA